MGRIRRIHDKEIRALERKCQIKNNRLRTDLVGGKFKMLETAGEQVRQSKSASGSLHPNVYEDHQTVSRRPVWFGDEKVSV